MTKFTAFFKDESGAAAAEYVLILAIIGSAIALAAADLGTAIHDKLVDATSVISSITIG